ncbi:MAG: Mut7-C RNAse domain-containing protein [Candidatus Krumholzibacteriales bacterium]
MNRTDKFLFDRMLGSLCRRMRLLGFDSRLNPESETGRFLLNAEAEGRLAVTLSVRESDRPGKEPLILRSRDLTGQILELLSHFPEPPPFKPFTRCLDCNRELSEISAEEARGRLPDRIPEIFSDFMECPECGKAYWKGSHYEDMLDEVRRIEALLEEDRSGD